MDYNNENHIEGIISLKKYEYIKIAIMCACFSITLGAYSLIKELKDSVFLLTVGQKYIPDAKIISYLLMLPLLALFSFLSSRYSRYWLLSFYAITYGLGGLISAYYIADPVVGLANTVPSVGRFFGWFFYLFLEGYNPFVVNLLWAFLNSISKPKDIKTSYIYVTIASKIGGITTTGLAWLFMSHKLSFFQPANDVDAYLLVIKTASYIILLVPILLYMLSVSVPRNLLEGYTNKRISKEEANMQGAHDNRSGFSLLMKYPYVLGIYGMIFFWEIVNVVFNYMRLLIGLKEAENIADFSAFLYKNAMITHCVGLIIVTFGTSFVVRTFGERVSLVLIPILTGGAIIVCLMYQTNFMVLTTYVFIRAIHYAFSNPLREALYIPTVNAIKFKSKAWIDSFGGKFSKLCGSAYNKILNFIPNAILYQVQMAFFVIIVFLWTGLAYALGKKWEQTIKNKEMIGEEKK